MNNRPDPKSYKNESISPTKCLEQPFIIQDIQEDEYDGKPQLCVSVKFSHNAKPVDVYVSNRYVMRFLRDIKGTEAMQFPLEFYKKDPTQRHYEIRWAGDDLPQDELPF